MDEISNGEGIGKIRRTTATMKQPNCGICGREMHAIDSGAQFRCSICNEEWTIRITGHAWDRWEDRSKDTETHPIEAWKNGIPWLDEGTRLKGNEFRYYHDARVVMIRKGDGMTTAIDVLTARVPIRRATVRSLIRDGDNASEIATLCRECDITVSELKDIVRFERGIRNADALVDKNKHEDISLKTNSSTTDSQNTQKERSHDN